MSLRRFLRGAVLLALLHPGNVCTAAEGAGEEKQAVPEEDLLSKIEAARERITRIDGHMKALDEERERLHQEAREAHRRRFEVRREVTEKDEEVQALIERLEELQREMHEVRTELGRRMAEQPEYLEQRERQEGVGARLREANKETGELSEERVRVQLQIQRLERRLQKRAEDAVTETEGQHDSIEGLDNP